MHLWAIASKLQVEISRKNALKKDKLKFDAKIDCAIHHNINTGYYLEYSAMT